MLELSAQASRKLLFERGAEACAQLDDGRRGLLGIGPAIIAFRFATDDRLGRSRPRVRVDSVSDTTFDRSSMLYRNSPSSVSMRGSTSRGTAKSMKNWFLPLRARRAALTMS